MQKNSQSLLKKLLYILIIALIVNYVFSILLAFTIPMFDGRSITGNFPATLQGTPYYGYVLLAMQVLFFFCINRICVSLEKDPERGPNETIMKAKKFSAGGFIFGFLMLATFFLFVEVQFDIIINDYIYNAGRAADNYYALLKNTYGWESVDDAKPLLDTHLIYAAVWVIFFGTFFMIGTVFTNFYVGRLLSYYAGQKNGRSQSFLWRGLRIFGIIWSLQFLISYLLPWKVSILIHGALLILFSITVFSLSKQNFTEIQFKSPFALRIKETDAKAKTGKYFERIVQISMLFSLIIFGILWFGATFFYSYNKAWYDWGFYLALGGIILISPIFALKYAKTPAGQWILKKCFLIISLIGMFYFALAIFSYSDLLNNYMFALFFTEKINYTVVSPGFIFKSGQVILLFLLFFTGMISLLGLKHGLLPTTISAKRKRRDYFNILKMSNPSKIFALIFITLVAFSIVSYEGLGAYVRLENDTSFSPRISFWEWDGEWDDHDNATLDKLSTYNMSLYGGYGHDESYKTRMERYYDRNISIYATGDNYAWIDWIEDQRITKSWDKCPIAGFIEDIEDGGSLFTYNRTQNEQERASYEELIDYVHKHNFTQHFTAMHTTINDQRDGDLDVTIFNQIHSVPPLDWDSWNWMIYRTESATSYNEKSPYFTYLWVKELQETFNLIYDDRYDSKLSVSLGVVGKNTELYQAEDGLEQFIWDLRICDALKIPEIIIFTLNNVNSTNFMGLWGIEAFDIVAEAINNWTTLDLYYSRSATFMGNIKYIDNPMGSVFGNFWLDIFLDKGVISLAITWIVIQLSVYIIYLKKITAKEKITREKENK